MNGILNLDKPPGITSHDCVARIRRAAKIKRVGHAGTLDPMATGVLLLCIGQATRLAEFLMGGRKVYRAEITFGAVTDTQDSTGTVLFTEDASSVTAERLTGLFPRFTGEIEQVPPMVSALHHEGRRLYEIAREGGEVDRQPRPITIYGLELLRFQPGSQPKAEVEVACSAGTYIRTLAHDFGAALGCGAHMSALRRTAVGPFRVEDAVPLEDAEARARTGIMADRLTPMQAALADGPRVPVPADQMAALRNGRDLPSPPGLPDSERVGLIGPDGELAAVARARDGRLYPYKVLLG